MDEIKTNIEKIFDQFSDSDTINTISKRLSFDCLNDSFQQSNSFKRRNDSSETISNPTKKIKNEKIDSNISLNSSIVSSPWETRRMRADLIEAKSIITQLKQEIKHQNTVRIETDLLYSSKTDSLQKQVDHSTSKIIDLEKHLTTIRKREGVAREELNKVKNQLNVQKVSFEERLNAAQKLNNVLNEEFRDTHNDLQNTITKLQREIRELNENLKMTQEESDTLQNINFSLQEKADNHDYLEKELENEKQKLSEALSKIKDLEYEIGSYEEWKDMSKTSLTRLSKMADFEKEVIHLRQETKNLKENIGNKLILEEQVFDLTSRLERYEKSNNDCVAMKVQISTMEQELKEWKSVAADHCSGTNQQRLTPMCLRSKIEQILQKDLILSSEKTNSKSVTRNMSEQLHEMKTQLDIYTKSNTDLKSTQKRLQNIIQKIQRKLIIVAGERDCYKRLLDNHEKDLTITAATSPNSPESQLRIRIEMLEKTLTGYKDICANLEKEIQTSKDYPEINLINNDNYEKLRKELDIIHIENERLKRRKDELELELEHRSLRGDFNMNKYKVLHLESNPAAEAYDTYKNELEKLQVEIEKLRRRNRKLEERDQEITMKFNESNVTINVQEANNLRQQVQSLESKNQHLKEIYKAASQEFREVCYMLFGYRVDRTINTNYRISNMYAESEDDFLNFRLNDFGVLDMLETNYSSSLSDMIRNHLGNHNSLPAFLSTLTLELFNRSTVTG